MSKQELKPELMTMDELKEFLNQTPTQGDAGDSLSPENADSVANVENAAQKEQPESANTTPDSQDGFKFDRKAYEDRGVTDETALSLLEEKERRLWEKDKFIGKQSTEVGNSRKREEEYKYQIEQLEAQKQALQQHIITTDEYNELAITSPFEAAQKFNDSREAQKTIRDIENQQDFYKRGLLNRSMVPDADKYADEIVSILRDEINMPERQIAAIKDNLESSFDAPVLDSLVARAKLRSETRSLQAEIKRLQEENQKLQAKPTEMIDRMKAVRQSNPTMSSTGVSAPVKVNPLTNKHPGLMTMDELKQIGLSTR